MLGQHILRLRPRANHALIVEAFNVKLMPDARVLWSIDIENNTIAVANFNDVSRSLHVEVTATVTQYNDNPWDFIVEQSALNYPIAYYNEEANVLAPYRVLPTEAIRTELTCWITQFWDGSEPIQCAALLERMGQHIFHSFSYTIREEQGVQLPTETLQLGSGSCRDFAVLFIEAARCLGFAARFVSGYLHSPPSMQHLGSTHAWAEVYLPGAGWKGFDPTVGGLANSDNIPVAASVYPERTSPVSGVYTGAAESNLDVGVWVTRI